MSSPLPARLRPWPAARIGLAGLAVVAGLTASLAACHRRDASIPPAPNTLKVEMGKQTKLDPEAALRCFVHGQFVGMQTPAECAQKNGVAPGALDVGLDQSGALAAGGGDTPLQPLSNAIGDDVGSGRTTMASADPDTPDTSDEASGGDADAGGPPSGGAPSGDCMRYGASGWRAAGHAVSLNVCVHTLFAGRCPPPGQTVFGRWGGETLRLMPGRIAMSTDNREFHPLTSQDPVDCSVPSL